MPPRTLHVHTLIDGLGAGGAELLLTEFATVAPSVGIRLTVAYLRAGSEDVAADRLRRLGIEPELVPVTRLLNPLDIRRVRQHVAGRAPDIVHTHLDASDFLGTLAAHSLGLPAACTLHGFNAGRRPRDRVRTRLLEFGRRRWATRIIAVSDHARRAYVARSGDPAGHTITVHNGVAGEARRGEGRAVRRRLGLDSSDFVVATVSTLRPEKAHEVAIAAVASLRRRFANLRLIVVGDGPRRRALEELAAPLGDACLFTGFEDDVMALLDAVDVVVHPSERDAFPTALLEAMAAGVPVVASRVGGIPEIVQEDRTGVLVPGPATAEAVATALAQLLGDRPLRDRLGAAGRARFEERFSAAAWAGRLREVYDGLLRTPPHQAPRAV